MKTIISFLIVFAILSFGFTQVSADSTKTVKQKRTSTIKNAKKTEYVCPMDKDVVSSKPGICPKCGMKLQKKTASKTEQKSLPVDKDQASYSCPMDKDVVSSKPGKCPKCGMDLVKTTVKEDLE